MIPKIKVRVEFFSPEDGGRITSLYLGERYMPHIRIIGDTEYLGVQFVNAYNKEIAPGEIIETEVRLPYYPRVSYEKLKEGQDFEILEGPRIVGKGKTIGHVSFD
jgi:hypothetical protein